MKVEEEFKQLENRGSQLRQELAQIEERLRMLRSAECTRCGGSKQVALRTGLYGAAMS
jgi:hypothetical protein